MLFSANSYAQVENSILKIINFKPEDIENLAILDVGATSHFLVTDASEIGLSVAINPITMKILDDSKLTLIHERELNLLLLPKVAKSGHFIPGMSAYSLMYVVTLCNAGCRVVIEEWIIGVTITNRGNFVMEGN